MSVGDHIQVPSFRTFSEAIIPLDLPISASELHGVMCGYLASGSHRLGESYLRALIVKKNEAMTRDAARMLFSLYTITEQQLQGSDFEVSLMLPDDSAPIFERARAFSEWCEGFSQGLTVSGLQLSELSSEEAKEAVEHITEFADLDYESVSVDETDEKALTDVVEHTRMGFLHIYYDTHQNKKADSGGKH